MEPEITKKAHSITTLKRAKKYAKRLKSWYWFIPLNFLVTSFFGAMSYLMYHNGEPNTVIWILMFCPMGLWVIFIVEGIVLYKPKAVRSWEERQLNQYMRQDFEAPKYE